MSARTMNRYKPGVTGGMVAVSVEVYDCPGSSVPVNDTRPSRGSRTCQAVSADTNTVSAQVPVTVWSLTLVTVQLTGTGSPVTAAAGTVTDVTRKSLGGGSSMIIGSSGARSLLFSLAPSNTLPMD